jgi:hypothetical protein
MSRQSHPDRRAPGKGRNELVPWPVSSRQTARDHQAMGVAIGGFYAEPEAVERFHDGRRASAPRAGSACRSSAIARRLVGPPARMSTTTGTRSWAVPVGVARNSRPERRTASASPPSFTPWLLASWPRLVSAATRSAAGFLLCVAQRQDAGEIAAKQDLVILGVGTKRDSARSGHAGSRQLGTPVVAVQGSARSATLRW